MITPITNVTKPMHMLHAYMNENVCDKESISEIIRLQLIVNEDLMKIIQTSHESSLEMLRIHQSERRKLFQLIRKSKRSLFTKIIDKLLGNDQ